MDKPISMAEACRRTGIGSHALRYYESVGLMKRVGRSGTRLYVDGGQRLV